MPLHPTIFSFCSLWQRSASLRPDDRNYSTWSAANESPLGWQQKPYIFCFPAALSMPFLCATLILKRTITVENLDRENLRISYRHSSLSHKQSHENLWKSKRRFEAINNAHDWYERHFYAFSSLNWWLNRCRSPNNICFRLCASYFRSRRNRLRNSIASPGRYSFDENNLFH